MNIQIRLRNEPIEDAVAARRGRTRRPVRRLSPAVLTVLVFASATTAWAQSEAWVRQYRAERMVYVQDEATAMTIDTEDNVYVTGIAGVSGGGWLGAIRGGDITTLKYNPDGEVVWKAVYATAGTDAPADIAVDTLGNVYVTGVLGCVSDLVPES